MELLLLLLDGEPACVAGGRSPELACVAGDGCSRWSRGDLTASEEWIMFREGRNKICFYIFVVCFEKLYF